VRRSFESRDTIFARESCKSFEAFSNSDDVAGAPFRGNDSFAGPARAIRSIAPEIRAAIDEVLAAQQFVLGPLCEAFEQEVAQASGTRYGVGVASGTEALELALHACGVSAGDEVIVPAFTFIATGSAVTSLGARPVFADIEPATFNLDRHSWKCGLRRERAPLSPRICSVLPPTWIRFLRWLQARHSVIEDNAQSIGATYHGRKTGSMGRAGCLSFYPTKNLGAYGDAGMIVTDDEKLATRLRALRNTGRLAVTSAQSAVGTAV